MLFAQIYYLKLSFPIASGTKPFYTYFYKIQIKNENNKRYNVNFTQSQKKNKIKKISILLWWHHHLLTLMQTYLPMYDISRTLFGPSLSIFQSVVTHYPLYIYTYTHILYFRGNFDVCELFEPFGKFDRLKYSWGRDDLSPN